MIIFGFFHKILSSVFTFKSIYSKDFDFTCSTWQSTGSSISLKTAGSHVKKLFWTLWFQSSVCHYETAFIRESNILEFSLFLREHPHVKVSVLVGLKGGGDDEVLSRGETEVGAHLSEVDEGLRACFRWVPQEEVSLQMHLPFARVLGKWHACKTVTWEHPVPLLLTYHFFFYTTLYLFLYFVNIPTFSLNNHSAPGNTLIKHLHLCIHTSSGSYKKAKTNQMSEYVKCYKYNLHYFIVTLKGPPYLIDGKANGLHVLPHFPHPPSVLLHQAHDDGAALLAIIGVIIHILQLYDKLRIHPEGVWGGE